MTRVFSFLLRGFTLCIACLTSILAHGKTSTYTNTSVASINAKTSCGGGEISRAFFVPKSDDFIVTDLDVGFLATHVWRGDMRVELTSPAATTVRIIKEDVNNAFHNNYNVELDDAAGTLINTAPHNTNDGIGSVPPYENLVRPNNALSAFNGEKSAGTWTLTICDTYPEDDDGQFRRADLFFTHATATGADLSLGLAATNTTPTTGTNVFLTFTVANTGPLTADKVTVDITLPAGLSYVSDDGLGAYNSATGLWSLASSLAGGGTADLHITAFVNASGSYAITSDIASSNQADPDSTPGNSNTGEDDYASLTLNPVTPAVPTLTCPAAPSILDWDTVVWNVADMTNTYTVDGETIVITVTDPGGTLYSDAQFGGQTPAESIYDTGGLTPGQSDLHFIRNASTRTSTVDVVYNLGIAGVGVAKMQLSIFDVDFGTSQFEDKITVTGSLGGTPVTPTLFTSTSNSATGNVVIGNAGSSPTTSNGNMTLEFNAAVDKVTIKYGNGNNAPVNPGNQGISIHDLNFCRVQNAELTAGKTTAVYDPLSEGLYMVPGNDVVYTISFTNIGEAAADNNSVVIIDAMPSEIEFYNGDIDDGGPETTAVTGTDNSSNLTFNYATDVRFSNAGSAPANFAACGYTPSAGYDPAVTYICVNPKGAMAAGAPNPSFDVKFRARIR